MSFSPWKYGRSFGFLVLVVALTVGGPAAAEPGAVIDEEVTQWFESKAMDTLREISSGQRVLEGEGFGALTLNEPQFGAVFHVHTWTPAFLSGEKDARPTEGIDQWVAPLFDEGKVVGTVVAWRDPELGGEVTLAYFDDDAEAGLALAGLPDGAHLVLDPPLSSYFTISEDRIRPLSGAGKQEIDEETDLRAYQKVLGERYSGFEHLDPKEGYAGGGPTVPIAAARSTLPLTWLFAVGLGLALVGLALFVVDTRRRRQTA